MQNVFLISEILSGRYVDDFEADDDSDEIRSSGTENSEDESRSTHRKQTVVCALYPTSFLILSKTGLD